MSAAHILVAEDDEHIREGLVDTLISENYQVTAVCDGKEALAVFAESAFDLVVLDIMMPEVSGYDVCRQIRKKNESIPIVMLTAKGEEIDKVVGLQLGADDYITKPFGVREFLARVEAVLRRCRRPDGAAPVNSITALPEVFVFGSARIDSTTFRGVLNTQSFDLTPREMRIIEYFFNRPGKVISREELMEEIWEMDYTGNTRTLDQHIAQLRKKIEPAPHQPQYLTTVHGLGYRYEGEGE